MIFKSHTLDASHQGYFLVSAELIQLTDQRRDNTDRYQLRQKKGILRDFRRLARLAQTGTLISDSRICVYSTKRNIFGHVTNP